VEIIKRQTRAAYGCLVAGQSRGRGLSCRSALSVTTAPLQLPLVAL